MRLKILITSRFSLTFLSIAASVLSIFFMNALAIIFQHHGLNDVISNSPQSGAIATWENEMNLKRNQELVSDQQLDNIELSHLFLPDNGMNIPGGDSIVE